MVMKVLKLFVIFLLVLFTANTTIKAEGLGKIKPKNQKNHKKTPAFSSNFVIVKVVNESGELIMTTKVPVSQFLDKSQNIEVLPKNSMFILFRGNTAYYLVENNQS